MSTMSIMVLIETIKAQMIMGIFGGLLVRPRMMSEVDGSLWV